MSRKREAMLVELECWLAEAKSAKCQIVRDDGSSIRIEVDDRAALIRYAQSEIVLECPDGHLRDGVMADIGDTHPCETCDQIATFVCKVESYERRARTYSNARAAEIVIGWIRELL